MREALMLAEPNCSQRHCRHFLGLAGAGEALVPVCRAFPGGIPADIAYGDDPHTTPHAGDHGLRYEAEIVPLGFAGAAVPEDAITVRLPAVTQQTNYTCGAAALSGVCRYWGIAVGEGVLAEKLGTTAKGGTRPDRIVAVARELGLTARVQHPMGDDDLRGHLADGVPVLLACQAWGDPEDYDDADDAGHYLVAIGCDQARVYFEDSYLGRKDRPAGRKPRRGYLSWRQLDERWHDTDADGKPYVRWGVALSGPEESAVAILSATAPAGHRPAGHRRAVLDRVGRAGTPSP